MAQKRANGFGLFDVLGNVLEWVNDTYDLRSGFWAHDPRFIRISYRLPYFPGIRNDIVGFRCGGEVFAP